MKLLTSEWVTLPDTPEGEKYKIRGLTGPEAQPLVNLFYKEAVRARREGRDFDPNDVTMPSDLAEQILSDGLLDWSGIEDAEGKPLRFKTELATLLPYSRTDKLIARIIDKTDMGVDREKNSSSPSKSKRKRKNSTA